MKKVSNILMQLVVGGIRISAGLTENPLFATLPGPMEAPDGTFTDRENSSASEAAGIADSPLYQPSSIVGMSAMYSRTASN